MLFGGKHKGENNNNCGIEDEYNYEKLKEQVKVSQKRSEMIIQKSKKSSDKSERSTVKSKESREKSEK